MECINRVGLAQKIMGLEKGIKTPIGREYENDGVDFSGGERQKIVLARSLYKSSSVIILDEPTAALDPIAEADIYESFNHVLKDQTAIFISHRLSSCRFCDKILVFDGGSVVQEGSHNELIKNELGVYHELWNAQSQYYIN